ncbi:hypothetical protein ACFORJ_07795 [Corynebacterium hansenii]|uniref:Uncharacterized protein n=1 Tax=Corynebacterium hansenii TaxID=394964 RepID=A0ABV7ZRP7_9CORY|nr:hypothetical protein [Corynebacterium hansenii]WJZ00651.1 hypothetical protein CHAN_10250 [Corynebacterium hansenii]
MTYGLDPMGPGRDIRVEGPGVPQFETPLGAPTAEAAAGAWRGQIDEPRDDILAELREWADGLPGKLRDIFKGNPIAGFEEVAEGIRDGIFGGIADAIRGADDLGSRLLPIRDAARGLIRPVEERVEKVELVNMGLHEGLYALEDMQGYVCANQSAPAEASNNSETVLPFGIQVGDSKGGGVREGKVWLDEPGMWLVMARVTAGETSSLPGFGIGDYCRLKVSTYPSGGAHDFVKSTGGGTDHTLSYAGVRMTEQPSYFLLQASSARRRVFPPGSVYSSLIAVKLAPMTRAEVPGA